MMTLAQMAYFNEEDTAISDILDSISEALANPGYATSGDWILDPNWQGGRDATQGNFMFLAWNQAQNQYALAIRGSDFDFSIDWLEDFSVWQTDAWPYGGSNVQVSSGSLFGLQSLLTIQGQNGQTLLDYLNSLSTPPQTLFVSGHSLGGALSTLMSAYLCETLSSQFQILGYSFGSPTVGTLDWTEYFSQAVPNFSRYWIKNDFVPRFWEIDDLGMILTESIPSPVPMVIEILILGLISVFSTDGPQYSTEITSNELPEVAVPNQSNHLDTYLDNIGLVHNGNTYLQQMNAPTVPLPSNE